jgi:hypothetical protein
MVLMAIRVTKSDSIQPHDDYERTLDQIAARSDPSFGHVQRGMHSSAGRQRCLHRELRDMRSPLCSTLCGTATRHSA